MTAREAPVSAPVPRHPARLPRDPLTLASLVIVVGIALAAILAPYVAPRDPYLQTLSDRRAAPGSRYVLGADEFGRDILSRLIYGAGLALRVSVVATGIGLVVGSVLGFVAGLAGGLVDEGVMRTTDVLLAFPYLLLAIAIVNALGPGETSIELAIGCWAVPSFARLARGSVLALREREFVVAARAQGAGATHVLARHILPNATSPLVVLAALFVARAIMMEAALGFLGLGAQPPAASWGTMVATGRDYLRTAPHIALAPGIAIAVTVLAFNVLADGLRNGLDPRMRTS
jgi:peptide/nickel transport system permease protein